MKYGTVKRFNAERGWGFIRGDDGLDIFVHHSEIRMRGFRKLEPGQRVRYDVEPSEKGKQAVDVEIIEGGQDAPCKQAL